MTAPRVFGTVGVVLTVPYSICVQICVRVSAVLHWPVCVPCECHGQG